MSRIARPPSLPSLALVIAVFAAFAGSAGLLGSATDSLAANHKHGGEKQDRKADLDRGLVGYWKFEGSGEEAAADSSGKDNNGVFINSGVTSGRDGHVLKVTGDNNSHFTVPASPSLAKFDDQITVTAWVFPETPVEDYRVIASRQIGTLQHPDQFYLGFGVKKGAATYKWHLGTIEDGKVNDLAIYTGTPTSNRWVHLAGVYDGSTMTLYVDGSKIGEQPATGKIQVDDNPVTIGAEENGAESHVVESDFNGEIDEVRIYNRALNEKEIKAIYDQSAPSSVSDGVDVPTQRNDIARSGLNLREKQLNTGNVRRDSFGKLFSRAVDDEIYAQLLVASGLEIPGKGVRNVVFAATVNNSIYAFDADNPDETEPLWHINYTPEGARPTRAADMTGACHGDYKDFSNNIGIVGTPVIDRAAGTMYFVARSVEDGHAVQRLHAVDITDGSERPNSPVAIAAAVPGTGRGNVNGMVVFDPLRENQRTALLLLNGVVYMTWAGHCDWPPYHGWVMGYDAARLKQAFVWNATPDGGGGGIWQSGQGLASDGTYIYAISANGWVDAERNTASTGSHSQAIMKLAPSGSTLDAITWFSPHDWQELTQKDIGLGSTGLLLVPGTHLGIAGSKGGMLYVVDTEKMGGVSKTGADDNIVQSFGLNQPNNLHGTPLFWKGPDGARVFAWANEDHLKSFPFHESYERGATVLDVANVQESTVSAPTDETPVTFTPGGFLTLSADGDTPGSAVLWASLPLSGNANQAVQPGILRAFDAADVGRELWNDRADAARDSCGDFAKFVVPTVANGKVYLGSFSNQFCVYGLLDQGAGQ